MSQLQSTCCDEKVSLRWQVHPWKSNSSSVKIIFIFAVVILCIGVFGMKSIGFGLLGSFMLLGGLAEFWMPQTFELSERGAKSKIGLSSSEIDWKSVKCVINDRDGIRVLPVEKSARMAVFRGVWLRPKMIDQPELSREQLTTFVELLWSKNAV